MAQNKQKTRICEGMEKLEPLCTIGATFVNIAAVENRTAVP